MATFRDYCVEIATPEFQVDGGREYMTALGDVKDSIVYRASRAVKARFPTQSPYDGQGIIGAERGIARGVGETKAAYGLRLRQAWATWERAGTPFGLLRELHATGYTNCALRVFNRRGYSLDGSLNLVTTTLQDGEWLFGPVRLPPAHQVSTTYPVDALVRPFPRNGRQYRCTVAGTGAASAPTWPTTVGATVVSGGITWTCEALPTPFWSKFIVLFPQPRITRWVSDGTPAESSSEAQLIKGIVRRFRPAFATASEIAIATSARCWDYYPAGSTYTSPGRATWDTDATDWTHWTV